MGQLVGTILAVMVLLVIPLGIVQVHTVLQLQGEVLDLAFATAKFISNRGGTSDGEVRQAVSQFLRQELDDKGYDLDLSRITVKLRRTKMADPFLWSHEDEFFLRLQAPYPQIARLFLLGEEAVSASWYGTVNVMDYDL